MQIQTAGTSLMQAGSPPVDVQAVRAAAVGDQQPVISAQGVVQVSGVTKSERSDQKQPSVEESVRKLNETVAALNRSVQFSIDEDTRMNIVKVVDVNSKEVIRQIPTQEVVEIAKAIDKLKGLLFSDKA